MPGSSGGLGGDSLDSLSDSMPDDDDLNPFVGVGSGRSIGGMKYGNDFPGLGVY